jgi:hypothetical protein
MSFVPIALEAEAGIGCVANFIARRRSSAGTGACAARLERATGGLALARVAGQSADLARLRAFLDFTAEHLPPGCL